jgi:hypothetical protein
VNLYWYDHRYAMPLFWNHVQPTTSFALTSLIQMQSVEGTLFIPQLRWLDAVNVNIEDFDLTIGSDNLFTMRQVFTLKLVQPHFRFHKYPADVQTLRIRLSIFNYPNTTATIDVYEQGVDFLPDSNGKCYHS